MTHLNPEDLTCKTARAILQFSRRELAEELETSPENIKNWETKKSKPPAYLKLALKEIIRRHRSDKAAPEEKITCLYCNAEIEIKINGRNFYAKHNCMNGLLIKSPFRNKEELLRMLSPTVQTKYETNK